MIGIKNAVLGAAGSVYGPRVVQATAGVGQQVLDSAFNAAFAQPGWFLIKLGANQKLQVKREDDTNWDDITAVAVTLTLYVDGRNVRVDQATAAQNLTAYRINEA